MQNSPSFRSAVVTFDQQSFSEACFALMQLVVHDGKPDALIGIRTGGLYVAEAMAKAAMPSPPVLSLTCRRPSTRYKTAVLGLRNVLGRLPRPIVDRLRVLEHSILEKDKPPVETEEFHFDAAELSALDAWLRDAGPAPSLVVVDDAVDSGATLRRVLDLVGRSAPRASVIRSAVITVTTRHPWVQPSYTLYHQRLCRFPWSLDA